MLSIVCTLVAPLAVFALETGVQTDRPDPPVPTAIERALMDRACIGTETTSAESYAHRQCIDAKLLSLRADFGRDLSRLSPTDRRRIDAACSRLRATDQREAYLDCLGGQLMAVHNRENRGKPTVPEEAPAALTLADPDVVPAASPLPASSNVSVIVIGGTVGSVLAAAGFVFLKLKPRRPPRPCRVCGVAVPDSDLCPTCRHEAAEAVRRAALERAQTQKAQEEEERRHSEQEAEQREQRARDEEEARLREEQSARQRREEEEELHRQSLAAAAPVAPIAEEARKDDVFDPYAVLGVPSEAGQDDIRIAYQQAMTKYDPELVSYLGDEAQAYFKERAQTIERAYQMLAESRS